MRVTHLYYLVFQGKKVMLHAGIFRMKMPEVDFVPFFPYRQSQCRYTSRLVRKTVVTAIGG